MATVIRTTIAPYEDVILTAGMTSANGHRLFALFASEADARSEDADSLAIATLGEAVLTAEQIAIAERNSENIR